MRPLLLVDLLPLLLQDQQVPALGLLVPPHEVALEGATKFYDVVAAAASVRAIVAALGVVDHVGRHVFAEGLVDPAPRLVLLEEPLFLLILLLLLLFPPSPDHSSPSPVLEEVLCGSHR